MSHKNNNRRSFLVMIFVFGSISALFTTWLFSPDSNLTLTHLEATQEDESVSVELRRLRKAMERQRQNRPNLAFPGAWQDPEPAK